jgi:hypothetical protein
MALEEEQTLEGLDLLRCDLRKGYTVQDASPDPEGRWSSRLGREWERNQISCGMASIRRIRHGVPAASSNDRHTGVQIAMRFSGASKPARAFRRKGLSCPSKTEGKCSPRRSRDIPREVAIIRPRNGTAWVSCGGKRGTTDQQERNTARGTQFAGGWICCGRMPPADEHQWCEGARADSVIKSARDNDLDQPMAVKRNPCRIGPPDV